MLQRVLSNITDYQRCLDDIRNQYWLIRTSRHIKLGQARRRKAYRVVQKIKAVLLEDGFDPELLRLYCRQFASLNPASKARYEAKKHEIENILQKTRNA